MAARARLIPAPGRACCRSARFDGAMRDSTGRGSSDCWIVLRFLSVIGVFLLRLQQQCHGQSPIARNCT
jgi:hypothetical protein